MHPVSVTSCPTQLTLIVWQQQRLVKCMTKLNKNVYTVSQVLNTKPYSYVLMKYIIRTSINLRIKADMCIHIDTHIDKHTRTSTYTHMHTHRHIQIHICTYIPTYQ